MKRIIISTQAVRVAISLVAALFAFSCYAETRPHFSNPAEEITHTIELIDQRLALMPEVAAWKRLASQPVTDIERERVVIERSVADAKALGLDSEHAQAFFDIQIRMARFIQEKRFSDWQTGVRTAPKNARDLNIELRPKLDRIGRELLTAAYLAAPELSRVAYSELIDAQLRRLLRHDGIRAEHVTELHHALVNMRYAQAASVSSIKRAGVLRVGMTGDYAPFSSDRDGALQGFDVQLAQALANHWGVTLALVRTSWSTLMSDMQQHRFDIAMSGISVTPERAAQAEFSTAYHVDGKTPIARCQDALRFTTLEKIDLPKVRVIVNPGGTNERFVREQLKRASIIVHADNRTVFDELVANHADVMITDGIEVQLQTQRHPSLCGTMLQPMTQTPKAILLPLGSDIKVDVDTWLKPQIAGGALKIRLQTALFEAR